jgi:hypothetical protein
MRSIFWLACLVGLAAVAFAYPADEAAKPAEIQPTPESELAVAHGFLTEQVALYVQSGGLFGLSGDDANYLRFFTTFAVPADLRGDCEAALSFVLNSTSGVDADDIVVRPLRVPGSATLLYVNIKDFGWDVKRVDAVAVQQPYFLAPLVTLPGSILFRADWFVVAATDVTYQDDRGVKEFPYYLLQYGAGNDPKNAADFQKAWLVDINLVRAKKVERGLIIDAGDSGVSRHTRQLRRARTILGYYWETRDVKSHDIDPLKKVSRDYIEDIFANLADAGEYIASNKRRLQTYLLTAGNNDKFKRVEFGDPTIVLDKSDAEDRRVRTAKGCIVCHAAGINPGTNALAAIFQKGGDILAKDHNLLREIQAFYFQNIDKDIKDDNSLFEEAVLKCNGLTPLQNAQAYLNVYGWYMGKVTLEQAALECGLAVPAFRLKIAATTQGRLTQLFQGKAVPRDSWDSLNGGGYVQAMALIRGLKDAPQRPAPIQAPKTPFDIVTVADTPVYDSQSRAVTQVAPGTTLTVLQVYDDWFRIETTGGPNHLFVKRADVKR